MELSDLWKQYVKPGTDLENIISTLQQTQRVPDLSVSPDLGTYGGVYDRKDHAIQLSPQMEVPQNTVTHEANHALFHDMQDKSRYIRDQQTTGSGGTQAEKQFVTAWEKLDPDTSRVPKYTYPDNEYNTYRHSFDEAPAFAVGRMADPRERLTRADYWASSPGGTHVDATLATEQAILRDLYRRSNVPTPSLFESLKKRFNK